MSLSSAYQAYAQGKAALAALLQAYSLTIIAALPDAAKVLRLSRELQAHVSRLCKINAALFVQVLRDDLEASPSLRARVRRELGGTIALIRWTRRRRAARQTQVLETDRPRTRRVARQRAKRWQPRTDSRGHYRLAIIPVGQRRAAKPAATQTPKPVTIRRRWVFRPLQITTEDLQFVSFGAAPWSSFEDANVPSSGHAPPIFRPPIR